MGNQLLKTASLARFLRDTSLSRDILLHSEKLKSQHREILPEALRHHLRTTLKDCAKLVPLGGIFMLPGGAVPVLLILTQPSLQFMVPSAFQKPSMKLIKDVDQLDAHLLQAEKALQTRLVAEYASRCSLYVGPLRSTLSEETARYAVRRFACLKGAEDEEGSSFFQPDDEVALWRDEPLPEDAARLALRAAVEDAYFADLGLLALQENVLRDAVSFRRLVAGDESISRQEQMIRLGAWLELTVRRRVPPTLCWLALGARAGARRVTTPVSLS